MMSCRLPGAVLGQYTAWNVGALLMVVPAPPASNNEDLWRTSPTTIVTIGAMAGCVGVVCLLSCAVFVYRRKMHSDRRGDYVRLPIQDNLHWRAPVIATEYCAMLVLVTMPPISKHEGPWRTCSIGAWKYMANVSQNDCTHWRHRRVCWRHVFALVRLLLLSMEDAHRTRSSVGGRRHRTRTQWRHRNRTQRWHRTQSQQRHLNRTQLWVQRHCARGWNVGVPWGWSHDDLHWLGPRDFRDKLNNFASKSVNYALNLG